MQYSVINYSPHTEYYNPSIYLFSNWDFIPFEPFIHLALFLIFLIIVLKPYSRLFLKSWTKVYY